MQTRILLSMIVAGTVLFLSGASWADVPAPPVNQFLGFPDIAFGELTEADCRVCHTYPESQTIHDSLDGQPIPSDSLVLYPDADGDGNPDTTAAKAATDMTLTIL